MPINDEQAKTIKEQILKQVEQLPEDKREQIKQYILGLNNEQLEEFLKKNAEAQKASGNSQEPGQEQESAEEGAEGQGLTGKECIVCMLSSKKIESFIIYEDPDYLAALEINPYSKGHTILIPKKHLEETKSLKPRALILARKIGKFLIKKLGAESFQLTSSEDLKHAIVNIIPVYKNEKLTYQRKAADKKELAELKANIGELKVKPRKPRTKKDTKETIRDSGKSEKKFPQYPRRIP